jgi:hypothetical protein
MTGMRFEDVLPRLVAAYHRGLLTPFIGSGMSAPSCPTWNDFIRGLEQRAGMDSTESRSADELMRRADRALAVLRLQGADIRQVVGQLLYSEDRSDLPKQSRALASIEWPLVLTTNYDDLYLRSVRQRHQPSTAQDELPPGKLPEVLGRSPEHCERVLQALTVPMPPIVWALQGHLPHEVAGANGPSDSLIVGEADYRRVSHREEHFRRTFAHVFRQRSMLFLGFSLVDRYFLDLFGEVLELTGQSPYPHFAFLQENDQLDAEYLWRRFNTVVVPYETGAHEHVAQWIGEMAHRIGAPVAAIGAWSYQQAWENAPPSSLTIVAGRIAHVEEDECVVFSCGLTDDGERPWISGQEADRGVYRTVCNMFGDFSQSALRREDGSLLWKGEGENASWGSQLAFACPWRSPTQRSLTMVADAMQQALDWAASHDGVKRVRMALLAAGKSRPFPARFSLIQMVRGYKDWAKCAQRQLDVVIHVEDAELQHELRSGRLSLLELLAADDIQFWVFVRCGSEMILHEQVFEPEASTLGSLASRLGLGHRWSAQVDPLADPKLELQAPAAGELTLREAGIIPGSILRFIVVPAETTEYPTEPRDRNAQHAGNAAVTPVAHP